MAQRTDAYTLDALADIAGEVEFALFFSESTEHEPALNIKEARDLYARFGAKIHSSLFQCDVCGARYRHGALFTHPDGSVISVGETCADKVSLPVDRAHWRAHREEVRRIGAAEKRRRTNRAMAKNWIRLHPEAAKSLGFLRNHKIGADLRANLIKWGSLTPGQVDFAHKLARQVRDDATAPAPVTEPIFADRKRADICATIINVTFRDSAYGGSYKMLLAVDSDAGRQKLWGTCPQAIFDQAIEECEAGDGIPEGGAIKILPGRRISFTAQVQHGSDPDFAFLSRPSKANLLPA